LKSSIKFALLLFAIFGLPSASSSPAFLSAETASSICWFSRIFRDGFGYVDPGNIIDNGLGHWKSLGLCGGLLFDCSAATRLELGHDHGEMVLHCRLT
jgi:hypothetical protein